jgi:hypothetical protein
MVKYNICLIQPGNYIHTLAFSELGELIFFSLKELGIEATMGFNRVDQNFKNIIIGCHLLNPNLIDQIPKNTIILNTEQIYSDATSWNKNIFFWAERFEVWDYSEKNIQKFNEMNLKNIKILKIGFQKELIRLNHNKNKDIDILFYGSLNQRRKEILDELETHGLKIKVLFGVYGKERDAWIERSKIVLNHHFYNSHIFEIVRVFYLLTNSVAVVGEVNETTSIDAIYKNAILARRYDELVTGCLELARNDSLRKKIEKNAFDTIHQYPQIKFTNEIIFQDK